MNQRVDQMMQAINDILAEARCDEPAGRGAGWMIEFDNDAMWVCIAEFAANERAVAVLEERTRVKDLILALPPSAFYPGAAADIAEAIGDAPAGKFRQYGARQDRARLTAGFYRIHWHSGGTSMAAVGCSVSGDNWIAPLNWIAPGMLRDSEGDVAAIEPLSVGAERHSPLTAGELADALGCFWNAAIGAAIDRQAGIDTASIMAEGVAAVKGRLEEIEAGKAAIRTAAPDAAGGERDHE